MHIVIDARVINSGTGTYVRELLNHLQLIDTTNRYTVLVPTKDLSYWQPKAANFSLLAADFANYSFAEQLGFGRFLKTLSPDLVHFCMPQQPLLYKGKRVTTFHDMTLLNTYNSDKNWLIFHIKQLVGRWVWKRVAEVSDHVITISHNTKREYQEFSGIPDSKMSVIYEAGEAHPTTLSPYTKLPFKTFILYVGQQPDYKNIRRLGDAHQLVLKKHPELGLVLVGRLKADARRNQAYFERHEYQNIHFTDYIDDSQRDWLYTKATAYVFPSLMEGFGLPPLEAMAYGTPVISSNTSCMPEVLGDAPLYFDPTDVHDIAAKIEQLIENPKLQQQLRERGKQQVKRYSWEETAKQTHAVYMKLLRNTP